jgi:hypothetical protein
MPVLRHRRRAWLLPTRKLTPVRRLSTGLRSVSPVANTGVLPLYRYISSRSVHEAACCVPAYPHEGVENFEDRFTIGLVTAQQTTVFGKIPLDQFHDEVSC